MRFANAFATGLALVACPAAASAQRNPTNDVVVTGKRAPEIETTRAILRAIAPRVGPKDQLPRLFDAACIKVGGVRADVAQAIADRMATNAAEAGLKIGSAKCQANVLVFVATDGKAQARDVVRRQSYIFGGATPTRLNRFTEIPGPARIFTAIELASADGDRANSDGTLPTAGGGAINVDAPQLKVPYSSRMAPNVRRVVGATILVLDRAALVDKTPVQIADYATMRVLAGASYTPAASDETILALLETGTEPPSEMTKIDRSLLVEMYRNRALQSAQAEINAAARIATRD